MATYRAAYYGDTVLTTQQQFALPEDALVEAAIAEAHHANVIGSEFPRISEEKLRSGLIVGEWSDGCYRFEAVDVAVTSDNQDVVRAVVPGCLREEVEAGDVVTVRTGLRADYDEVVLFETGRGAVVTDGQSYWGDVGGGLITLDHDDGDEATVVDAATGEDVSREAESISVTLSEQRIRECDGCDTDEAVEAVAKGIRAALAVEYPRATVEVDTSRTEATDLVCVETLGGGDPDKAEGDIEETMARAFERTISDGLWADAA